MKKHSVFIILLTVIACTSSLKRNVAQTSNDTKVKFYDSGSCSADQCSEKEYDLSQAQQKDELLENLNQLQKKSKSYKSELKTYTKMEDLIRFQLGDSTIAKSSAFAALVVKSDSPPVAANKINEIFAALKNNFIPPLVTDYQLFYLPIEFFKRIYYNKVDKDLRSDPSYDIDPEPSSFWQPLVIKDLNLFYGFERKQLPKLSEQPCEYDKPKSGWGVNPGFHVLCGDQKYKVKLGMEVFSGSFNSRLYWALGYNVPIVDFVESPTVAYSRRLLAEFNSRKVETIKIKLAEKDLLKIDHSHYYSPFDYIQYVVLKDNSKLNAVEFKNRLFRQPEVTKPELDAENYNVDFESQIKSLVFVPAAFLQKSDETEIGAWKYSELGHENRREVRGLQLLAAWVGNFDMRMDNTRLTFTKDGSSDSLKHTLVDVGSGLGSASNLLTKSASDIERMPWYVTKTYYDNNESQNSARLQIVGLMNIELNQAFKKMSFHDGQWMVNKLCQISDDQLKSTLIAAGLNSAQARLAFEKLLSSRTQMVEDFELANDLKFCQRSTNRKLNYSEQQDGLFTAQLPNQLIVHARSASMAVKDGHLATLP